MLRDRIAALDGAVTQYFTGHTSGLYCEIKGRRGNHALRSALTPKSMELRERGAASFNADLTPEDISALTRLLDAIERLRDTGADDALEDWMRPYLVLKPYTVRLASEDPLPEGLLSNVAAKTHRQVEREIGIPVEHIGVTLYRNRSTDDATNISADWHFDRRPTDWMRSFIYLTDVDADCGPFHYFDKRTSAAFCRRGFRRHSRRWQARVRQQQNFIRLVGPPASGLLANAERILHRAGVPEPGRHRDMFEFIFKPKTT